MTNYRLVTRHVRYWRGSVHRWSCSYAFTGALTTGMTPSALSSFLAREDVMLYGLDATDGGSYEAQFYDTDAGGSALATYTAFDWTNPSGWVPHDGSAWTVPADTPAEQIAETALQVTYPGGLGSTGKPVGFRHWFHAVPQSPASAGSADVSPTNVTALEAALASLKSDLASFGIVMGRGGRFAGTGTVNNHYGNHQMPRGRRRKALVTSSGRYTGPTITVPLAD